jgi:pimeloyl-ACP methyl ester carboxylesterase
MTIDQPSFFLMGAADGLNKVREIREAELRAVAPGLTKFVMLPEVGHWPHREAADQTNDLLVTFLNERYRWRHE